MLQHGGGANRVMLQGNGQYTVFVDDIVATDVTNNKALVSG